MKKRYISVNIVKQKVKKNYTKLFRQSLIRAFLFAQLLEIVISLYETSISTIYLCGNPIGAIENYSV